MKNQTGGFTIPGQTGYEKLTMELAKKWGADAIRDSDGTKLSDEIMNSDYEIYSTVCIIRDHNEWIKENPHAQQQTFLITSPNTATADSLEITLLDDFFDEHVKVNEAPESIKHWQVFDRTTGQELSKDKWFYRDGAVIISNTTQWHTYTVSFLAYRIWEEISMYNHTTNNWDKEHLMQLDPVYPQVQDYLLDWMEKWCEAHPKTSVVRFTSLFYNFTWIWGSSERQRNIFTDWGSYLFAVSPLMLENFSKKHGYELTAEDFVNGGKYRTTHMPPDSRLDDWMDFVSSFVAGYAKKLVDVVHKYKKQAYVFYDDCWIGMEPYGKYFPSIGFDGMIKCVFSGFEVRLCSDVPSVETREIRLHPYLFPVGLNGTPTFSEGGNPAKDAMEYWVQARRALLRASVDRIGLGGYLSLTEPFPEFHDAIAEIADEFRLIRELHSEGAPSVHRQRVGVLTAWGDLRRWTCCGHYHENPNNDLINLIETLSGLAFDVHFIDFDDIKAGYADGKLDVIINAGFAGSAWSGGDVWCDEELITAITKWVNDGGVLLGVGEPSAVRGHNVFFRLAHILGIDRDTGERVNHGKMSFETSNSLNIQFEKIKPLDGLYLTNEHTEVLCAIDNAPVFTTNKFGNGVGIYLSSYQHNLSNADALEQLILAACKSDEDETFLSSGDKRLECTYFPNSKITVIVNNSPDYVQRVLKISGEDMKVDIKPYGLAVCKGEN